MSDNKSKKAANIIGYWMSEKKSQKLNWTDFASVCRAHGYSLIKINLDIPLEEQGPFTVILHKLTDIIAQTIQGNSEAVAMIEEVETYIKNHPEVAVIDPLENVYKLLDRYVSYRIIHESDLEDIDVFTPTFVELTSDDIETNIQRLKSAGVSFPFVCKPSVAHGTSDCHKMTVIFSEAGVADCKPPCVAQTFVNHNAVLYKIYVVGGDYKVVERPSLKNFYPCNRPSIHFDSHDVSKSDSSSSLNILDPEDEEVQPVKADEKKLAAIVTTVRRDLGMSLLGIDVVVENGTGRHAIIDINAYPGYDGYPGFFEGLMKCILKIVEDQKHRMLNFGSRTCNSISSYKEETKTSSFNSAKGSGKCFPDQEDSGFDTSDSSDEKKRKQHLRCTINSATRTASSPPIITAAKKYLERQH